MKACECIRWPGSLEKIKSQNFPSQRDAVGPTFEFGHTANNDSGRLVSSRKEYNRKSDGLIGRGPCRTAGPLRAGLRWLTMHLKGWTGGEKSGPGLGCCDGRGPSDCAVIENTEP